jgi:hypothetical protein
MFNKEITFALRANKTQRVQRMDETQKSKYEDDLLNNLLPAMSLTAVGRRLRRGDGWRRG